MITILPASMNPNFSCNQASNKDRVMRTIAFEPSNPFNTQTSKNGFSINAKAFTPSASATNTTKLPVAINSTTFSPTTSTYCASAKSTTSADDSQCDSQAAA